MARRQWQRRRRLYAGLGAIVVAAALAYVGIQLWGGKSASAKPEAATAPVSVSVVVAKRGSLEKVIAGIGAVTPLQSVTVRTRVDGEVTALPFSEGDLVKAGDVIAEIDPRQLEAAVSAALAKKQQDEAQRTSTYSDRDRAAALAKKGFLSAQDMEEKESAAKQIDAAIASDDAAIATARAQLGFATIKAPISGLTGFRMVDVGGIVSASGATAIVDITELDPIGLLFVAPGDRFDEIRQAMRAGIAKVEVLSTDADKLIATGRLTLMDNAIDQSNGSIKLRASFDNKDMALWPGLPVATRLTIEVNDGVLVPDAVLSRGPSGLYALVVGSDDKVERRDVTAAFVTDGMALVTKGIAEGYRIVSRGREQVGPGMEVAVQEDDPAGQAPEETPAAAKTASAAKPGSATP